MLVYGTFVLKRWFRLAQPGPATDCRWGGDLSRASAGEGSAMAGPAQLVEPQICIVRRKFRSQTSDNMER